MRASRSRHRSGVRLVRRRLAPLAGRLGGACGLLALGWTLGACRPVPVVAGEAAASDPLRVAREAMVREQLAAPGRDIRDPRVLDAMRRIPRHEFVPADLREMAYFDQPLPIGHGQTISQPYIVAFMSEALKPRAADRVLEIGTGSGYQAAVLAALVKEVYTIEIVEPLAKQATATLRRLGHKNVEVKAGDGYQGWAEHAPFDAVIVTCAPERIPEPLVQQLKEGGRMIIPVGPAHDQSLVLLEKKDGKVKRSSVLPVRFVPMTGKAAEGSHPRP